MEIQASGGSVVALAFSADGSELLNGYRHGVVDLYSTGSGKRKARIDVRAHGELTAAALASDGKTFVTGHSNGAVVRWYRGRATEAWIATEVTRHAADVQGLGFLADGLRIATAALDGRIFVSRPIDRTPLFEPRWRSPVPFWRAALASEPDRTVLWTGEGQAIVDTRTGQLLETMAKAANPQPGSAPWPRRVATHQDRRAFVAQNGDVTITRDGGQGKPIAMQGSGSGGSKDSRAVFSPDGATLYLLRDGTLHAWDALTGIARGAPQATGGSFVTVSPDGRWVAVTIAAPFDVVGTIAGGRGPRVALFRSAALSPVAGDLELFRDGYAMELSPALFTPDGRLLVGSAGQRLTILDVASAQRLEEVLALPDNQHPLGFAPGSARLLAAVPSTGSMLEMDLRIEAWADQACRLAGRTLTPAEWARYVSRDLPYRPACDGSRFRG